MTLLVLLLTFSPASTSADTLRLAEAFASAEANFPLTDQKDLAERIAKLEIETIEMRFRPSIELEGQGTYHSSVPELPFSVPGTFMPDIPHDQYKAAVNVRQLVYDGGAGALSSRLAEVGARRTFGEVEVALHDVKERVADAFFAVLLQDAALETLALLREDLEARRSALEVHVDEGLADANVIDVLDVELLGVEQQTTAARQARQGALDALGVLTGVDLSGDVALAAPDVDVPRPRATASERDHPQYRVFDATRDRLSMQREMVDRKRRPLVAAFASGAYGRPAGMDIFETRMSPFFSVGLRASWSPWDWSAADREQAVLTLQQETVDTREEAFTQGLRAAAARAWRDVLRLETQLEQDREIERLRARIAERAADQLDGGTISATEYLIEQHAEYRAVLARRRHEIELCYAKVRYLTILGATDDAL